MMLDRTSQVETTALTVEVESLLDTNEPQGVFHDTRECEGKLLLLGLLLISPPTPRPKTETR